MEKGALKNFAKFTRKHLCQSLFSNKVAGLRPATLLKKEILAHMSSCEFWQIFMSTFFTEHLRTTASKLSLIKPSENGLFYFLFDQLHPSLHYKTGNAKNSFKCTDERQIQST